MTTTCRRLHPPALRLPGVSEAELSSRCVQRWGGRARRGTKPASSSPSVSGAWSWPDGRHAEVCGGALHLGALLFGGGEAGSQALDFT